MKRNPIKNREIGIRELKARASELVRAVKEERARYVITRRGKPTALIIPIDAAPPERSGDQVWDRLAQIGDELSKDWKSNISAVEILAEIRR
jgi:prevent-host-death family protein